MKAHSLRLRLLLIWALAIVCSLTLAGIALVTLFSLHVERVATARLTDDLNRLAALIDADTPAITITQPLSDPRFDVPYGGRYWQVRDPATGQIETSRSTWDQVIDLGGQAAPAATATVLHIADPEGAPAFAVARTLEFELSDGTTRALQLVVAEDSADNQRAVAAYTQDLVLALVVLTIILVVAGWAQVTLGLAPLAAIRRGVNAIRTGASPTMSGEFPSEVMPLVNEVNELTRAQEFSIEFARQRASDLAHGLKGQLQVLSNVANDLRKAGHAEGAVEIETLTAEMSDIINHQLGLSRLRRRMATGGPGTDLVDAVDKIVRTLAKTARGGALHYQVDVAAGTSVALDRSDLNELLGALIENACEWAAGSVRVYGGRQGEACVVEIEDDGPGLPDSQLELLGTRGLRLDERRPGSGIGLAVVREIVGLNGGTLAFGRGEMGGLLARVTLPAPVARLAPILAAD